MNLLLFFLFYQKYYPISPASTLFIVSKSLFFYVISAHYKKYKIKLCSEIKSQATSSLCFKQSHDSFEACALEN